MCPTKNNSTWGSYPMSKTCSKCKKTKDVSEFHGDSQKNGRNYSSCAACHNSYMKGYLKKLCARTHIDIPKEKLCTTCGITRLSNEFSPSRGKVDGLHSRCHGCSVDLAYAKRAKTVRGWLEATYGQTPCTDCKKVYPWECMDFDHLDAATKTINICSYKANTKHTPEILRILINEISVCEIVCSNCHRSRTKTRSAAKRAKRQVERDAYAASKITRKRQ